jgi:hypothetical protein
MAIKSFFLPKALMTNTTLVLFEVFMDAFNVSSDVGLFECRIITKITFEGLFVGMSHLNVLS